MTRRLSRAYRQSTGNAFANDVVRWPARTRIPADSLTLNETVILRRKQNGDTDKAIGAALGRAGVTIAGTLRAVRKRFGVATTPELLALPRIQEILNGDGGDSPAAPR